MEGEIDRELLKQQRKERKKLKKQRIKEEKLKEQSLKTQKNQDDFRKDLNEKGIGFNIHIKSNNAIQATLESLQKPNKPQKKVENKKNDVRNIYSGNPLDSSQPKRFKGKYSAEPIRHKPTKLKADILKCEEEEKDCYSKIFIEHNNNLNTDELNSTVEIYVKKLVNLQDKAYFKDPEKIKFKKRYICGFHELKKKLIVGKIKFFIFATNIRTYDPIFRLMCDITSLAKQKSVRYVYALKRSKLGSLCNINRPVSCLGVLNHEGAEDEFKNVIENIYRLSFEEVVKKKEISKEEQINEGILEKIKELSIND